MSKVVVTMVTLNREHVDAVLRDFDFVAEIKRSTEIARGAGLSGNCNDAFHQLFRAHDPTLLRN